MAVTRAVAYVRFSSDNNSLYHISCNNATTIFYIEESQLHFLPCIT